MSAVAGTAEPRPAISLTVIAGALALLALAVLSGVQPLAVAVAVAAGVVLAIAHRSLLSWRSLLTLITLVILFVPMRRYTLPGVASVRARSLPRHRPVRPRRLVGVAPRRPTCAAPSQRARGAAAADPRRDGRLSPRERRPSHAGRRRGREGPDVPPELPARLLPDRERDERAGPGRLADQGDRRRGRSRRRVAPSSNHAPSSICSTTCRPSSRSCSNRRARRPRST